MVGFWAEGCVTSVTMTASVGPMLEVEGALALGGAYEHEKASSPGRYGYITISLGTQCSPSRGGPPRAASPPPGVSCALVVHVDVFTIRRTAQGGLSRGGLPSHQGFASGNALNLGSGIVERS